MRKVIATFATAIGFLSQAYSADLRIDMNIRSGEFDLQIAPDNENRVRSTPGKISFIDNGSWVAFQDFNFGEGATYFWIEAGTPSAGGAIEIRTGSETGPVMGTVSITGTGGFGEFQSFGATLSPAISGVQDLYLKFVGGGGYLFDTRSFRFQTVGPGLKQVDSLFSSVDFDSESNAGGAVVVANAGVLGSIFDGSSVGYTGFDFGTEANHFSIEGATAGKGGRVEVRIGSEQGRLVGAVDVHHTGSASYFKTFDGVLLESVSGVHDLYLNFVDTAGVSGELFHTRGFTVRRVVPDTELFSDSADEDDDGIPQILEYAFGMHPKSKDKIPLALSLIEAAGESDVTNFELSVRADNSLLTQVLVSQDLVSWEEVTLQYVNGIWQTGNADIVVSEATPQGGDLYKIRLEDSRTHTQLFVRLAVARVEGDLNVYPDVPGLDPSPYYEFSVQKVSALNAPSKETATNWEDPFAWFTRCVDYDPVENLAYYDEWIGSWSHTYCNFEMDAHTPIVVKITRLDKEGAPSGPITSAAVHPAHKVDSVEVINGEVYVTMSQPALVAVDIDGQMDSRDAPRALETGFGDEEFPYRNEMDAVHGVTIFANPFITDKPVLGDEGVFEVEPGTLPPSDGSWTTLYFKPGVHKLSVDELGAEREWVIGDVLPLVNNKNYYIPGDAIVYGNFNDNNDQFRSENIRVFGHGTLCGTKIPHFKDFAVPLPSDDNKELRMLHLSKATNCVYEGITIADQAEHGVYIEAPSDEEAHNPNYIKWVKSINWRVNNDGGGVTGNGYIEDCFFRHQDDALYVRGMAIRRTVFWSDVNGATLRCSFITHDRAANYPPTLPENLIVEDCDIIYARGVFAESDATSFGIITTPGGAESRTYGDGVINTAQHLIFRNIRISDPRPVRYLLGFHANPGGNDTPLTNDWAGIRFENIDYQHAQTWGWKNRLLGSADAGIKHWTFDNVFIDGTKVDAAYVNDPTKFETDFVSDLIFK